MSQSEKALKIIREAVEAAPTEHQGRMLALAEEVWQEHFERCFSEDGYEERVLEGTMFDVVEVQAGIRKMKQQHLTQPEAGV